MIRNWAPHKVRAMVVANLVSNAETAGKFLENEARRRLLAIEDPIPYGDRRYWGAGYRKYVAALIRSSVTVEPQAVVLRIGVAAGRSGRKHGLYIELGTSSTPPHPFLRPAVFDNRRRLVLLLSGK